MGFELNEAAMWLLGVVGGAEYPDGDEEGMWQLEAALRQAATELRKCLPDVANGKRSAVDAYPSGDGIKAMTVAYDRFADHIPELAEHFEQLAVQAGDAGGSIEAAKLQIYSSLVFLALELAASKAFGPAAPAMDMASFAATRFALRVVGNWLRSKLFGAGVPKLVARFALQLSGHAALGGVMGLAQDAGVQLWEIGQGHQSTGYNTTQTLSAAAAGAAGGAAGFGFSKGLQKFSTTGWGLDHLNPARMFAADIIGSSVVGGVAGWLGGAAVTGDLTFDYRMFSSGVVGAGVSMGAHHYIDSWAHLNPGGYAATLNTRIGPMTKLGLKLVPTEMRGGPAGSASTPITVKRAPDTLAHSQPTETRASSSETSGRQYAGAARTEVRMDSRPVESSAPGADIRAEHPATAGGVAASSVELVAAGAGGAGPKNAEVATGSATDSGSPSAVAAHPGAMAGPAPDTSTETTSHSSETSGRHSEVAASRSDPRISAAGPANGSMPAGGTRTEHVAARPDSGFASGSPSGLAARAGTQPAPGSPPAANIAAAREEFTAPSPGSPQSAGRSAELFVPRREPAARPLSSAPGRESASAVPEADTRGTGAPKTAAMRGRHPYAENIASTTPEPEGKNRGPYRGKHRKGEPDTFQAEPAHTSDAAGSSEDGGYGGGEVGSEGKYRGPYQGKQPYGEPEPPRSERADTSGGSVDEASVSSRRGHRGEEKEATTTPRYEGTRRTADAMPLVDEVRALAIDSDDTKLLQRDHFRALKLGGYVTTTRRKFTEPLSNDASEAYAKAYELALSGELDMLRPEYAYWEGLDSAMFGTTIDMAVQVRRLNVAEQLEIPEPRRLTRGGWLRAVEDLKPQLGKERAHVKTLTGAEQQAAQQRYDDRLMLLRELEKLVSGVPSAAPRRVYLNPGAGEQDDDTDDDALVEQGDLDLPESTADTTDSPNGPREHNQSDPETSGRSGGRHGDPDSRAERPEEKFAQPAGRHHSRASADPGHDHDHDSAERRTDPDDAHRPQEEPDTVLKQPETSDDRLVSDTPRRGHRGEPSDDRPWTVGRHTDEESFKRAMVAPLEVQGVRFSGHLEHGVPVEVLREVVQTIETVRERYGDVPIASVQFKDLNPDLGADDFSGRDDLSGPDDFSGRAADLRLRPVEPRGWGAEILLDARILADPFELRVLEAMAAEDGSPRLPGDPVRKLILRQVAEVLDIQGNRAAWEMAQPFVKRWYQYLHANGLFDGSYRNFVGQLSEESYAPSWFGIRRLKPDVALREAFVDVEMRGIEVTHPAYALYRALESARSGEPWDIEAEVRRLQVAAELGVAEPHRLTAAGWEQELAQLHTQLTEEGAEVLEWMQTLEPHAKKVAVGLHLGRVEHFARLVELVQGEPVWADELPLDGFRSPAGAHTDLSVPELLARNDCGPRVLKALRVWFGPDVVVVVPRRDVGLDGMSAAEFQASARGKLRAIGGYEAIVAQVEGMQPGAATLVVAEYAGPVDAYGVGAHTYLVVNDDGVAKIRDEHGNSRPFLPPDGPRTVQGLYVIEYDHLGAPLHSLGEDRMPPVAPGEGPRSRIGAEPWEGPGGTRDGPAEAPRPDIDLAKAQRALAEMRGGGDACQVAARQWEFAAHIDELLRSGEPPQVEEIERFSTIGYSAEVVERLIFHAGTEVIHKVVSDPRHAYAELLTSMLGDAVGARVPAVHIVGDHVYMEVVPGKTAADTYPRNAYPEELLDTSTAVLLGLLDALICIPDRNSENWMVDPTGDVWGIDHSRAYVDFDPVRYVIGPFAKRFQDYGPNDEILWKDHDVTRSEVLEIRHRVEQLRPVFLALGRRDWYDVTLQRLDALEEHAADDGGSRRIIALPESPPSAPGAGTPNGTAGDDWISPRAAPGERSQRRNDAELPWEGRGGPARANPQHHIEGPPAGIGPDSVGAVHDGVDIAGDGRGGGGHDEARAVEPAAAMDEIVPDSDAVRFATALKAAELTDVPVQTLVATLVPTAVEDVVNAARRWGPIEINRLADHAVYLEYFNADNLPKMIVAAGRGAHLDALRTLIAAHPSKFARLYMRGGSVDYVLVEPDATAVHLRPSFVEAQYRMADTFDLNDAVVAKFLDLAGRGAIQGGLREWLARSDSKLSIAAMWQRLVDGEPEPSHDRPEHVMRQLALRQVPLSLPNPTEQSERQIDLAGGMAYIVVAIDSDTGKSELSRHPVSLAHEALLARYDDMAADSPELLEEKIVELLEGGPVQLWDRPPREVSALPEQSGGEKSRVDPREGTDDGSGPPEEHSAAVEQIAEAPRVPDARLRAEIGTASETQLWLLRADAIRLRDAAAARYRQVVGELPDNMAELPDDVAELDSHQDEAGAREMIGALEARRDVLRAAVGMRGLNRKLSALRELNNADLDRWNSVVDDVDSYQVDYFQVTGSTKPLATDMFEREIDDILVGDAGSAFPIDVSPLRAELATLERRIASLSYHQAVRELVVIRDELGARLAAPVVEGLLQRDPAGVSRTAQVVEFPGAPRGLVVVAEPGQHVRALAAAELAHPDLGGALWRSDIHVDYVETRVQSDGSVRVHAIPEAVAEGPYRAPTHDEVDRELTDFFLSWVGQIRMTYNEWQSLLGPDVFVDRNPMGLLKFDGLTEYGHRMAADRMLPPWHPAECLIDLHTRRNPLPPVLRDDVAVGGHRDATGVPVVSDPMRNPVAVDPSCVVGAFEDATRLGFEVQQPVRVDGPVPPTAVAWGAGAHHERFDGGLGEVAELVASLGAGAGMLANILPVGAEVAHLVVVHNDAGRVWIHDRRAARPKMVLDPENPPFAVQMVHGLLLPRGGGDSTLESRQLWLGRGITPADPDIARGRASRPIDAGALPADDHTGARPHLEPAFADRVRQAFASGEPTVEVLAERHNRDQARRVEKLTFPDDTVLIRKYVWRQEHAEAEYLAALTAAALGARVPAVHVENDAVYMEYVAGRTGLDLYSDIPVELRMQLGQAGIHVSTTGGRLLGMFDRVAGNRDRNRENWIVHPEHGVYGIDHSHVFRGTSSSVFGKRLRKFLGQFGIRWLDPDLPGFGPIHERLDLLWPEFERLGRADWHYDMMGRLAELQNRVADRGRLRLEYDLARAQAQEKGDERTYQTLDAKIRRADRTWAARMQETADEETTAVKAVRRARQLGVPLGPLHRPNNPLEGAHDPGDAACGLLAGQAANDYYHGIRGGDRVFDMPALTLDADGLPWAVLSWRAGGHPEFFGHGAAGHEAIAARLLGAADGKSHRYVSESTRLKNSGRGMLLIDTQQADSSPTPAHSYFVVNHDGELLLFDYGGRFIGEFDPEMPPPGSWFTHGIELDASGNPVRPIVTDLDAELPAPKPGEPRGRELGNIGRLPDPEGAEQQPMLSHATDGPETGGPEHVARGAGTTWTDDSGRLRYENDYGTEIRGVAGTVDSDGILHAFIDAGSGTPSGREMFGDLWDAVGDRVQALHTDWPGGGMGDNLASFNAGIQELYLTPEDAARNTFSGRMATEFGLTEVQILAVEGKLGEASWAMVRFARPESPEPVDILPFGEVVRAAADGVDDAGLTELLQGLEQQYGPFQLASLRAQRITDPETLAGHYKALERDSRPVTGVLVTADVVDDNHRPVGFTEAALVADNRDRLVVHLGYVIVHEGFSGRGFSPALLPAIEEYCRRSGAAWIWLRTSGDGGAAWAKAGFDWFPEPSVLRGSVDGVRQRLENVRRTAVPADQARLGSMLRRFDTARSVADYPTPRELATLSGIDSKLGDRVMRGSEWTGIKRYLVEDSAQGRASRPVDAGALPPDQADEPVPGSDGEPPAVIDSVAFAADDFGADPARAEDAGGGPTLDGPPDDVGAAAEGEVAAYYSSDPSTAPGFLDRDIESQIHELERAIGIRTDAERALELSLFMEDKFREVALVSGQARPETLFDGPEGWASWLDARLYARNHLDQDLTVEFLEEIHRRLAVRHHPEVAGQIIAPRPWGAGVLQWPPTSSEIAAIQQNPLLSYGQGPIDNPPYGIVLDHKVGGHPAAREMRIPEAPLTAAELAAIEADPVRGFKEPVRTFPHGIIVYPSFGSREAARIYLESVFSAAREPGYDPYRVAGELQQRLVSAHCFSRDFNGRLSRIAMNFALEKAGLPPSAIVEFEWDVVTSPPEWAAIVEHGSNRFGEWARTLGERGPDLDPVAMSGLEQIRERYWQSGGTPSPFVPDHWHDGNRYKQLWAQLHGVPALEPGAIGQDSISEVSEQNSSIGESGRPQSPTDPSHTETPQPTRPPDESRLDVGAAAEGEVAADYSSARQLREELHGDTTPSGDSPASVRSLIDRHESTGADSTAATPHRDTAEAASAHSDPESESLRSSSAARSGEDAEDRSQSVRTDADGGPDQQAVGWRRYRMQDEVELARELYNRPESRAAAVAMLDRLREVNAGLFPDKTLEEIDAAFYAHTKPESGGMVLPTVSLEELRSDGNLREIISAVLNARFRNLQSGNASGTTFCEGIARLLDQPGWEEKGTALGLDVATLGALRETISTQNPGQPITAKAVNDETNTGRSRGLDSRLLDEYERSRVARRDRSPEEKRRKNFTVRDWDLLGMPLSRRELEAIPGGLELLHIDKLDPGRDLPHDAHGRIDADVLEAQLRSEDPSVDYVLPIYTYDEHVRRIRDDDGLCIVDRIEVYRRVGTIAPEDVPHLDHTRYVVPLPWEPGAIVVDFHPDSEYFQKIAVEGGIPIAAAISGTAARLMDTLGLLQPPDVPERDWIAATMGFLMPHHHTLFETVQGLRLQGVRVVAESAVLGRGFEGLFQAVDDAVRHLPEHDIEGPPTNQGNRDDDVPALEPRVFPESGDSDAPLAAEPADPRSDNNA
ncbi:GNAT family N-acetyltransferase [Nocardia sp. KC 131]|uniref:GNAT family N-acetyltransferase n=1 Tax=Nocardia arseniciresistens TaxID=3392119 RepID=UPI00398E3DE1